MKRNFLSLAAFVCLLLNLLPAYAYADNLHTPIKGSPERKAIMEALRGNFKQYAEGNQEIVFNVHYLKVHNGWAWTDVTPLGAQSKPIAEGGTALLHFEDGKWSSIDLTTIPADPDNPMGDQEASPGFLKNLHEKYPQVPMDIFPKKKK
jgi:hypothetical protein